MKIGIDIDDTVFLTAETMIKYANKYQNEILGRSIPNKDLGNIQTRYYLNEIYGWDNKTKFEFFNMYYKNILEECELLPNANKIIQQLSKKQNEIYFVTGRLTNIINCDAIKITIECLKKYKIPYNDLILNAVDKLEICKEKGITIFIEDSYNTCLQLESNGIKTYLITTKLNKNIKCDEIERVSNWNELYDKFSKTFSQNI